MSLSTPYFEWEHWNEYDGEGHIKHNSLLIEADQLVLNISIDNTLFVESHLRDMKINVEKFYDSKYGYKVYLPGYIKSKEMLQIFMKYGFNYRDFDNIKFLFNELRADEIWSILKLNHTEKDILNLIHSILWLLNSERIIEDIRKLMLDNLKFFVELYVKSYNKKINVADLFHSRIKGILKDNITF